MTIGIVWSMKASSVTSHCAGSVSQESRANWPRASSPTPTVYRGTFADPSGL